MIKDFFIRETLSTKQAFGAGFLGAVVGAVVAYFFYGTEVGAQKRVALNKAAKKAGALAKDTIQDLKYTDEDDEVEMTK